MNDEQKQKIKEKYTAAKQKGYKFWPDIIYKDMLVSFGIFLLLVGLAIFVGVANEPKADPSDSAYIPRPEWYFMFLFEMLKYFPGKLEWIGTFIVPTLAVLALFLLPFFDRNPRRHWSKRRFAIACMSVIVIGMVALTISAVVTTPPQEESETAVTVPDKITAGEAAYGEFCVECHGTEGEGGEIKGVEGLEGVILKAINTQDEMYTRNDETLFDIVNLGQPSLGMPPFGKAFGGELSVADMENLVTFMRYTWDDRMELPAEVAQAAAVPALGPNEVPSYELHIAPIIKRYCISCHKPGKKNNNYTMKTYEEVMTSGDNAPNNVIPEDLTSILIRTINREDLKDLEHPVGPMPPSKALKPELIELFTRWVLGGAPNTAAEAAASSLPGGQGTPASPTPGTPEPTSTPHTGVSIFPTSAAPPTPGVQTTPEVTATP